eukprot:869329_1
MGPEPQIQSSIINTSLTNTRNFSMVYIDLDDTLIPTTIRNSIRTNYGFDLFNFMNTKKLQSDIINTLEKVKSTIKQHTINHFIKFAVVSNASSQWIYDMIGKHKSTKFPILSQYLDRNEIHMFSSQECSYKYLCNKFGANKAKNIVET